MRVLIKVVLALVFAAVVSIGGFRLATGRMPKLGAAAAMTMAVFFVILAADLEIGW